MQCSQMERTVLLNVCHSEEPYSFPQPVSIVKLLKQVVWNYSFRLTAGAVSPEWRGCCHAWLPHGRLSVPFHFWSSALCQCGGLWRLRSAPPWPQFGRSCGGEGCPCCPPLSSTQTAQSPPQDGGGSLWWHYRETGWRGAECSAAQHRSSSGSPPCASCNELWINIQQFWHFCRKLQPSEVSSAAGLHWSSLHS